MAKTTTNFNLPYPESTDEANVPSDIQNLANVVDELLSDLLFYKSGDTMTLQNASSNIGHFTASGTTIGFEMITDKRLDNISSFSINGYISIRHPDGGYIANNVEISSLGTINCYISTMNSVYITIALNEASSFTNNTPVSIYLYKSITLTFA